MWAMWPCSCDATTANRMWLPHCNVSTLCKKEKNRTRISKKAYQNIPSSPTSLTGCPLPKFTFSFSMLFQEPHMQSYAIKTSEWRLQEPVIKLPVTSSKLLQAQLQGSQECSSYLEILFTSLGISHNDFWSRAKQSIIGWLWQIFMTLPLLVVAGISQCSQEGIFSALKVPRTSLSWRETCVSGARLMTRNIRVGGTEHTFLINNLLDIGLANINRNDLSFCQAFDALQHA